MSFVDEIMRDNSITEDRLKGLSQSDEEKEKEKEKLAALFKQMAAK